MRVLLATANPGKIAEFRDMLGDDEQWTDLAQLGGAPTVEETGLTFRENACIKAAAYAAHFKMWALADDSGLEVDAIDGKPGVHSARWADINAAGKGDADNNLLLLRRLAEVPDEDRTARFVCVLALSDPHGKIVLTALDRVEGRILREPRGGNGFGYDPLFLISELGKTTAELNPAHKHQVSHRGKALR
ncbi:MAG: RdgB/HAM1 family non-canonical purine NTP pyrophosphatase, partial [Tepidisphaeraceae bacterium]